MWILSHRVPSWMWTPLISVLLGPFASAQADPREDFLQFYDSHIQSRLEQYDGCEFDNVKTLQVPASLGVGLTPTTHLFRWTLAQPSRLAYGYKPVETVAHYAQLKTVPDMSQFELGGVFVKNSHYHAHLKPLDDEASRFTLQKIWLNSERRSQEDCPIDWLGGLPDFLLTYRQIAELGQELSWQDHQLETRIEDPAEQGQGTVAISAQFSPEGAIQSTTLQWLDQGWGHDIKFSYDDQGFIRTIDRYTTPDEPIVTRWLVSNPSSSPKRSSAFRLPAFGIPEPEGYAPPRFRGWQLAIAASLVLVSIGILVRWLPQLRRSRPHPPRPDSG